MPRLIPLIAIAVSAPFRWKSRQARTRTAPAARQACASGRAGDFAPAAAPLSTTVDGSDGELRTGLVGAS
ncbi:hypothetical protein [Streptomyces sp. NPDC004266]|uniref:hypothetical protein n=1 Tax=Streptomyces sp. NPDC004266 TaxID=3364693 RepID=UPI0036926393